MPSRSKAQFRFFKFLEENPEEAKKRGVSEKTAQDFTKDMTKSRWKNLDERLKKKK
jgi:hypothetical protein